MIIYPVRDSNVFPMKPALWVNTSEGTVYKTIVVFTSVKPMDNITINGRPGYEILPPKQQQLNTIGNKSARG